MSHVIGIDLGTTNSCVAVPANSDIPDKAALLEKRALREVGGALVIADEVGAFTTPSVVWVDRDGAVLVGRKAKQMAAELHEPPPAMFFKRNMGTTQRVTAGHAEMTPEEASAAVLRHMKKVAEDRLGEPVERAVVTVPAFFDMRAKQSTTKAGEMAGLDVIETLLEPVAAALMYTRTEQPSTATKIMAYDLGGGTFDASIVSWDPDVGFTMTGFDGDAYLGGYDFDYAIVRWMIPQLSHYDLDLDEQDSDDKAILSRLLILAEDKKQDLSTDFEVQIVSQRIEDRRGDRMEIRLPMRATAFEQLIDECVAGTIASCDIALKKAGVKASDLAEIIMVGGSSRVPLVGRRLEERYGRKPKVVDPDLCVAVGAALKAAMAASTSSHLSVERPPAVTGDACIDITGRVIAGPALASVAGIRVELRADSGGFSAQETTNPDGGFTFTDVDLEADAENAFSVRVLVGGKAIDSQAIAVTHESGAGAADFVEGDVLAHDVSVQVKGGRLVPVAKAGRTLPYKGAIDLVTANQLGRVRVNIYDGDAPIGWVEVTDVPKDLPVGSPVHVILDFEKDWTISATAVLPSAGPNAKGTATIDIPRVDIPSWESLAKRGLAVRANWEETRRLAPPGENLRVGNAIDTALKKAEDLITQRHDPAQVHALLNKAETILRSIRIAEGEILKPGMSEFEAQLTKLENLIKRLEASNPTSASHHRAAARSARTTGGAAFAAGNALDWAGANESVGREITAVEKELGIDDPGGLPPAPMLQMMLLDELGGVVGAAHQINQATGGAHQVDYDKLSSEADAILRDIRTVDLSDDAAAGNRLVQIYQSRIGPLRAKVEKWKAEVVGGPGGGPIIDVELPATTMGH